MSHAPLTPADFQRIKDAFISAFSSVRDLQQFTRENFSDLDAHTDWQASIARVADDLAHEAHTRGQLPALLTALANARPNRADLRALAEEFANLKHPERSETQSKHPERSETQSKHPERSAAQSKDRADHYAHITLPPNYIPRPELLAAARDLLLQPGDLVALTSAIPIDALHGMGGIGKTVLARALCDDPAVRAAFPDGILWAEIGKDPDEARLRARLTDWLRKLDVPITETAPSLDWLKDALANRLRDAACLLILDDVWDKPVIERFRVTAPRARLLITTRNAAMIRDIGGQAHPVPLMRQAEAITLLERWSGDALAAEPPAFKAEIVRRLHRLPLAIQLAGARLPDVPDLRAWLSTLRAVDLESNDPDPRLIHDSLAATFAASLNDLAPADRRAYLALAIFRADEPVLAIAAGRLWSAWDGRAPDASRALLNRLAARALVIRGGLDADGVPVIDDRPAAAGNAVVIHDLLRDFMADALGPAGLHAAHTALLTAYRATQTGHGWPTAPDDGYLYDHLAYHLAAAAPEELPALFADPAWLHARLERCARETDRYLYDGYLADLQQAWHRAHAQAEQQIAANEDPTAIAECIRYALIRTSVNSLAESHPPELVARAVEAGLWTPRRALSLAARVPNSTQRSKLYTLCLALPNLTPAERTTAVEEGLAAAFAIEYAGDRALALAALAPQLGSEERAHALARGLQDALALKDEGDRALALAALAPQLSGEEGAHALEQGLQAALALKDKRDRVHALAALTPQLSDEAREPALAQGLRAALALEDDWFRAQALATLAPQLRGKLLARGLKAALALEYALSRAWALAALALQLSGEERAHALEQGLQDAFALEQGWFRVEVLAALASQLSGEAREQALTQGLQDALAFEDQWERMLALVLLAAQLRGEEREQALAQGLQAALAIDDEWNRASALAVLTPPLRNEKREQARVPQLSDELLTQRLREALTTTNDLRRAERLAELAPHLSGDLLAQGLQVARAIRDEGLRTQTSAAFIREDQESQRLIPHILRALLDHIDRNLPKFERADLLRFCADDQLFRPPILPRPILATIATHITDICSWTWL